MFITWSIILIACFTGRDHPRAAERDIVSASADETFVVPGRKSFAFIRVMVKEGYHIQANKVNNKSLIPVTLEITQNKFFMAGKPVFPPYKLFHLEGTERCLNVFDSLFIIRVPVKAATGTEGRYFIKAKLHYQACNAKTCLFPRTLDLEIPIVAQKHKSAS
jgi:hypothetical protein